MNRIAPGGGVEITGMPAIEGLVVRHFEVDRDYPGMAEHIALVNEIGRAHV